MVHCFRYFGWTELEQVDRMSLKEFRLLNRAHNLREVDDLYRIHQQAFQNLRVQSTKKAGKGSKLVYSSFDKFFDYKAALKSITGPAKKETKRASELDDKYFKFLNRKGQNDG